MNFLPIIIIPSKFKILRCKYSTKTISIILAFYHFRKSFGQISNYVNMSKATVAYIFHWSMQSLEQLFDFIKYIERLHKLAVQAIQVLICYCNNNSLYNVDKYD